ncbi:MAG: hypothetical protein AAF802_04990 [Planctomycetota bacterium]
MTTSDQHDSPGCASPRSLAVPFAYLFAFALCCGWSEKVCAQRTDEATVSADVEAETGIDEPNDLAVDLPVREHRGRALRALAVYQSQLVGLVPKNFRAVEIEVLADALRRGQQYSQQSDQARLLRGYYDVRFTDEYLVSERSELVIEHDSQSKTRMPLGDVNLAIESRSQADLGNADTGLRGQALFETDQQGNLIAVIPSVAPARGGDASDEPSSSETVTESKIPFRWTLSGELFGDARRFTVKVPRTAQTRFVLSAPSDFEIRSSRGVLLESPGPPPDADVQTRGVNIRWYILEAGGLDQFEIYTRRKLADDEARSVIVRSEIRQYEVDLASLNWRHRLTLETHDPTPERLEFYLGSGTVTGVSVNSIDTDFRVLPNPESGSRLQIELPGSQRGVSSRDVPVRASDGGTLTTITIEGVGQWSLTKAQCELPVLRLIDQSVIYTEPATQVGVAVSGPIGVASWELPDGWSQRVKAPAQPGETLLFADGPPAMESQTNPTWSTLRLFATSKHRVDHIWTSLGIQSSPSLQLKATTRVRCELLETPAPPIRFLVNEDWTVDAVTILSTGRQVSLPTKGELVIWPTLEESSRSIVEFDLLAHRNISAAQRRLNIPNTWVLRDVGQTTAQLIAIHPPKLREWDSSSVLLRDRVSDSEVSEEARVFFEAGEDSLLIASPRGEVPALSLQAADVSFSVDIDHDVDLQSDQVIETLRITPQSAQALSTLTVLLGATNRSSTNNDPSSNSGAPTNNAPYANSDPYEWSLVRKDETATVSIPRSSILPDVDDPLGSVTVESADRDLNEYVLFGQRTYNASEQFSVSLPSIRLARNQTGSLSLAADLQLSELPAGVQRVPTVKSSFGGERKQSFRFDPLLRPELQLKREAKQPRRPLVWRQTKLFNVSSRSEDTVVVNVDVSSRGPVEFSFDEKLELVSSTRNGSPVEPIQTSVGGVTFNAEREVDQFALKMRRRHSNEQLIRPCELPNVTVLGEIMEHSVQVRTPRETFVVWHRTDEANASAQSLWLMPRHLAIAFGFLGFGLIYLGGWSFARWARFGLHGLLAMFVVLLGAAVIWWDSQVPLAAWATLPVVLAALTHFVTRERLRISDETSTRRGSRLGVGSKSERDRSIDFSVGSMLLPISITFALSGTTQAQDAGEQAGPRPKAIQLIVPISDGHRRVGDKIYLSDSDFQDILKAADPDRPVDAVFRSAVYRVSCRASRDVRDEIIAEVFGEFTLFYDRDITRLNLPFRAETIRRIEWLGDGETQIIRYVVDANGGVTAIVPPSKQMQLRITFLPEVRRVEAESTPITVSSADASEVAEDVAAESIATEVRLSIPRVHATKLFVEAASPLMIDSLGDAAGRQVLEPALGRYEADLGNQAILSLRCRIPDADSNRDRGKIRRAYRIAAGMAFTTVECEIQSVMPVVVGDSLQLTILGRRPDAITSGGWKIRLVESGENPDRSDANPVSGGVYRFTKLNAQSQPVRLLWTVPSNLNDPTSPDDSVPLEVPEVFASAQNRTTRTAFAIEPSSNLRVAERAPGIEPIDSDDFSSQWMGYIGRVDRAFVVSEGFPSFVLLKNKVPPAVINAEHHLHLTRTQQQLRFRCNISDASDSTRRTMISIPSGFRLVEYRLNGKAKPSTDWIDSADDSRWLAVGDARIDGEVQIDLLAVAEDDRDSVFTIPRFELADAVLDDSRYRITREQGVIVQVQHSLGDDDVRDDRMTREQLLAGEIPVLSSNSIIDGNLRVRRPPNGNSFASDQVSVLRFEDGRWTCHLSIRFLRGRVPSYVDLQIPSRWATKLEFDKARIYGQRVSADGETTVVRVDTSLNDSPIDSKNNAIVLAIGLDSRELSRVTFPDVRVLGKGRRSLLLAVPNRLTQEELRWQPRSVRRVRPSSNWTTRFPNLQISPQDYSLFASDGPTWSISLERLARAEVEARALVGDARVYLGSRRAILFQHFDVIPETLDSVTFRLPAGSRCIGAWVAGRELDFDRSKSDVKASSEMESPLLRLPLAYSRLPQPIELLVELPHTVFEGDSSEMQGSYLCELVGLKAPAVWVSFYQSTRQSLQKLKLAEDGSANVSETSNREKFIELADSIVTCLEDSQDLLAERNREEIREWMNPWIGRFQRLAIDAERSIPFGEFLADSMTQTPKDSDGPEVNAEIDEDVNDASERLQPAARTWQAVDAWAELDQRLSQLTESLEPLDPLSGRPLSIPSLLTDYEFLASVRWKPTEALPVVERAFSSGPGLQRSLKNSISILTFIFAAALLWPIRSSLGDWVNRPGLWLIGVGIVMLMIAPLALVSSYFLVVTGTMAWHWGSRRRLTISTLAKHARR